VPGRSAEVADWLADMSGMLAALGVYWMHTKRSMRFRRES
jgi:VanZ family protein